MATTFFIEEPEPTDEEVTRSTSKTMNIKGSHNFTIEGYSYRKGMGVGKYIASDTFAVGGYLWRINFYPDGKKKDESGDIYVSLFVELVSNGVKNLTVWFEFYLLDENGNRWRQNKSTFVQMEVNKRCMNGPYTVNSGSKSAAGYYNFYKRSEFDASQFMKDDSFTVQCSVAVPKTSLIVPKNLAKTVPDLYEKLLESGDGSDISFEVEGKIFYAHKIILSSRSPVFKAQFFGQLKDHKAQFFGVLKNKRNKCIKIKEMQARVFKALLRYIYCDSVPDLDSESVIMTQHLLAAADRYGILTLKSLCESRLCENMAIDTVASTLALAEQHGCSELKSRCLDFIRLPENLEAVMETVDSRT